MAGEMPDNEVGHIEISTKGTQMGAKDCSEASSCIAVYGAVISLPCQLQFPCAWCMACTKLSPMESAILFIIPWLNLPKRPLKLISELYITSVVASFSAVSISLLSAFNLLALPPSSPRVR